MPNNDQQQVVGLFLPNGPEFVIAYLGIIQAGHIAFPLDPVYKPLELHAIIEQIPPALIVTNEGYKSALNQKASEIILFDVLSRHAGKSSAQLRLPSNEQVASLVFTSGTTGAPKAAPYTHANHIWNIQVCSKVWGWTGQDSLLMSLPLSHWYGLVMGLSGALYHGSTLYLQEWFDAEATLKLLSSGKVSIFSHTPQAYIKLLEVKNKNLYDLSKVRLFISGGAALPPKIWKEFKQSYGVEIIETYGSSETGRIAANRLSKRLSGSPGEILPGVSIKLDADGEVQIKSQGVFPGYFQNPAATSAGFTTDGYWRTGDIAQIRQRDIFLKGRHHEQIRRFGYSVSPRDVEWAMLQNPKIKEIYVVGKQVRGQPDDEIYYFVVGSQSSEEIRRYCQSDLPFSWRPTEIIQLKELPRNANNKVHLVKLRQLVNESSG